MTIKINRLASGKSARLVLGAVAATALTAGRPSLSVSRRIHGSSSRVSVAALARGA